MKENLCKLLFRNNVLLDYCVGRGDTSTNFSFRKDHKNGAQNGAVCQDREKLIIFNVNKHFVNFAEGLYEVIFDKLCQNRWRIQAFIIYRLKNIS